MSASCRIEINQSEYRSIEYIIEGNVVCTFSKSGSDRSVSVTVKGEEHAHSRCLDPAEGDVPLPEVSRARKHTGKNQFLSSNHVVVSAESFEPGEYTFPFRFDLCWPLPGSYVHSGGWIKYYIEVVIYQKEVVECKKVRKFNVVWPIDLNLTESEFNWGSTSQRVAKYDSSLCCFGYLNPVVMNVQVSKRAFVQGEPVAVIVDISNMLHEEVRSVEVKVEQVIEIHIPLDIRPVKDHQVLFTQLQPGFPGRREETYVFKVEIPKHVEVPNFTDCKLFSKTCCIEVTALVSSLDLKVSIPIVVGQIPLGQY